VALVDQELSHWQGLIFVLNEGNGKFGYLDGCYGAKIPNTRWPRSAFWATTTAKRVQTVQQQQPGARIYGILYSQSLPPTNFNLQTTPA